MRDKRSVDELSVQELERILVIRKREARQERLRNYETQGRRLPTALPAALSDEPTLEPTALLPQQHEAAYALQPVEPPVTYDITDDLPRFEDELEREHAQRSKQQRQIVPYRESAPASASYAAPARRPRRVWDKLLLAVEILGVVGIVAVLAVGGYLIIDENDKIDALAEKSAQIQREADAMRATPTLAPELRVRLSDYVLPGGHKYNDGVGTFNLDELPESVRSAAVAQLNYAPQVDITERPPSAPARIRIPKFDLDASIYGGDDWYGLQKGVGHLAGSVNPGERGNMVLSAHNDIYGELFRRLPELEVGDEIQVMAKDNRWYTYVVRETTIVGPNDVWVLRQGSDAITTLITCYPYQVDTHRFIVFAELVEN
ncbi:MAG: class D sortase [Anaerolineae bacterium]|nr:class D sortase [Anaerolineae bacterium]